MINTVYFAEEARSASSVKDDFGLAKLGIVVDETVNGIILEDGFLKMDVYFAKLLRRTSLTKSLPGRHLVETMTVFVYENGLTLTESEFKAVQLEIFRILVGNGIISSCTHCAMVKAYKALKRNGVRALLAAAFSGESRRIRAWKCLTCKRFRAKNDGTCSCKGYRFRLPDNMTAIEIANMYPDAREDGGMLYSSIMPSVPKSCGVSKPRMKAYLAKSIIYELDDQISSNREKMDIDVDVRKK